MMAGFFAMGGYAAFVWPAYAVSAIGLLGAIVLTWRAYAAARARLRALDADQP
jgi:heme exporter protein D